MQVERDERLARGYERRACARVRLGRAEVGTQRLAAVGVCLPLRICGARAHARREPGDAATPQLGARAARRVAGELAVEEDGHAELAADALAEDERLGAGGAARARVEVDERDDVDRADVRVRAGIGRCA